MKGQTHYVSALLPKDLLSDLSISEDDFSPSNEEKENSSLVSVSIRRCISEDPVNTNSMTINHSSSHSSFESKEKTHLYKKSGTFPKSKAPFKLWSSSSLSCLPKSLLSWPWLCFGFCFFFGSCLFLETAFQHEKVDFHILKKFID